MSARRGTRLPSCSRSDVPGCYIQGMPILASPRVDDSLTMRLARRCARSD